MYEKELEAIKEALEQGAQIDVYFYDKNREEAQELIASFGDKLQKECAEEEWESAENQGEKTRWFETVEQDEYQIRFTAFFE